MRLILLIGALTGVLSAGMIGGWTKQDEKDPKMMNQLLALQKTHNLLSFRQFKPKLTAVYSQVVSGIKYKFEFTLGSQTCTLVYIEQAWLDSYTILEDSCSLKVEPKQRKPKNKKQKGGWRQVTDLSSAGVQACLSQALDNVAKQSNSDFRPSETDVTGYQKGIDRVQYKLTLTTGESSCVNTEESMGFTAKQCPVSANSRGSSDRWAVKCQYQTGKEATVNLKQFRSKLRKNGKSKKVDVKTPKKALLGQDGHDKQRHGRQLLAVDLNVLIDSGKNWLGDNAHDFVKQGEQLFGNDGHDFIEHGKKLLGDDGHDFIEHGKKLLGDDGHDFIEHGKKLLGDDGHDFIEHGKKLLGDDGHDFIEHGKKLLGGDGHDFIGHGKKLLGGDGHDFIEHGKKLLGDDGHDLLAHGKKLLGGDDHDLLAHGKKLLGGDGHDLLAHGKKLLGGDGHDLLAHGKKLLGGDGHDLLAHGKKLLGDDGHDLLAHGKKLLGGDDHDRIQHGKGLLGGDDHDKIQHGKGLLGGDTHDFVQHALRNGGSQRSNKSKLLGGDGHDDCHIGMFGEFKSKYNKLYGSQKEEDKRFMIFCDNMRMVRKLQQTEKGSATYGATKFADLTSKEFKRYVGKQWDQTANMGMKKAQIPKGPVPDQFDWRDHGAVTPVKNQGSCGSCWAFSTTGNIEGQWAINKKKLISLSEQELVDCDKLDEGCNGGLPSNAYKEIERLGGLETETEYAYKGEDEKCNFVKKDVKVYINSSVSISKNETEMAAWLFKNGPISIGINAMAMQFYFGGISHPWSIFCSPSNLDHGVLIVGYGVKGTEPYWIVKNSWGPDWGEQGYYLVYRGAGVCGLNTMCTSAVVN